MLIAKGAAIHPVVHVLLLKPTPNDKISASAILPDITEGLQVTEAILQRRLHQHGSETVTQVLIKWSGIDTDLATWEYVEALQQHFPLAPAWGQSATKGGGVTDPVPHPRDGQPIRSEGARPRSMRVSSPEWACEVCSESPSWMETGEESHSNGRMWNCHLNKSCRVLPKLSRML